MEDKQTELVYVPITGVPPEEVASLLQKNHEELERRGLRNLIASETSRIVGFFEDVKKHEGESPEGLDFSLNTFADERILDRMRVHSVKVIYTKANMPFRTFHGPFKGNMQADHRESHRYEVGNSSTFITPAIARFPDQEIVTISLVFPEQDHVTNDLYRRAIWDAENIVENKIRAVRSIKQLIQAFRTRPANPGFVERSILELYALIGRF